MGKKKGKKQKSADESKQVQGVDAPVESATSSQSVPEAYQQGHQLPSQVRGVELQPGLQQSSGRGHPPVSLQQSAGPSLGEQSTTLQQPQAWGRGRQPVIQIGQPVGQGEQLTGLQTPQSMGQGGQPVRPGQQSLSRGRGQSQGRGREHQQPPGKSQGEQSTALQRPPAWNQGKSSTGLQQSSVQGRGAQPTALNQPPAKDQGQSPSDLQQSQGQEKQPSGSQHPQKKGRVGQAKQSSQPPGLPQAQQRPQQAAQQPESSIKPLGGEEMMQLAIPDRKITQKPKKGRPIWIETNHFALSMKKLSNAIHYDVALEPDKPIKLLRHAVEAFRIKHFPDRYPAFDGKKNLYSAKPLPFNNQISDEVEVDNDGRPKKFKITIKFATYVDFTPLQNFFEGTAVGRQHAITPQQALQCLDIVLRSAPSLSCVPVGRSFFNIPKRGEIIELGGGMQLYHGFYQSAILGWKPFINVDVAHKAFPKSSNVIDLIMDLCGLTQRDLSRPLDARNVNTVDRYLRTLKVCYEIPRQPASKRVMRVNGLKGVSDSAKFKPDDGPEMTVAQYFTDKKNYPLRCPKMPCIWVGSRDRNILLPAELCTIVEGQAVNRKMDENQTTAMIKHASTNTKVRKNKIMTSMQNAQFNNTPAVREFGITVSDQFEKIKGRVLDPPTLEYSAKRTEKPRKGVWRSSHFCHTEKLEKWTIVCLDRRTSDVQLMEFAKMMCRQSVDVGMAISQPVQPFEKRSLRYGQELNELKQIFENKKDMQLIVVVIPDSDKNVYNYVKQAAELNVGCLTQCIRGRTIFRLSASTVGNIILKVNTKLNGVNHVLHNTPRVLQRPCMIMGADVTHPSPDAQDTPSFAAVTASHDPNAFKYNICWRVQPPKVEIIEDLEAIIREQLIYFYKVNGGQKPQHIIFFRDGVSEGQFEYVLNQEVTAIRRACIKISPSVKYEPAITFLVVQKRHHTRFFPCDERDSEDRNLNVPAGTCVDTDITHPTALDFYLVSHASIQGVARPTKYRKLWDDFDMGEEELEDLTYHLCHMFSRCTRSVSYPAPTYYAHLAAARAKVYFDNGQYAGNLPTIKTEIVKGKPMFFT